MRPRYTAGYAFGGNCWCYICTPLGKDGRGRLRPLISDFGFIVQHETIDAHLRVLAWYQDMGVDAALGSEAIDWLARPDQKPGSAFAMPQRVRASIDKPAITSKQPLAAATVAPVVERPKATTPPAQAKRTFVATTPDAAVEAARTAAAGAKTIDTLRQALETFDGCGLKATAKSLCFYRGSARARLMIVGEAPGREDDLAGAPFSGPAGDLLEKMLAAIGLAADSCHITNAVYWRPPGNRHPTPQELDVCLPFLERQTALVAPDVLLMLGAAAARQVMDIGDGITRVRGKWRDSDIGGHRVRVIASLSPTFLLKSPLSKQNAWRDMLAIKAALAL